MAAPPAQIGAYRILTTLGKGGMGTVYLAESEGARYALKVLHPDLLARDNALKRFEREADIGTRIEHENVVRTYECDLVFHEGEPCCFLVMEYVEGRTLRRLLDELDSVPEALLRAIARQTATGLAAIHAQGLVHRDVKPDNILVTDDYQVRIMDLGIARLMEASTVMTREGSFAGTLMYCAPEQVGGGEVGPAADLYALGLTLYELATGIHPYPRFDVGALIHAHLHTTPGRVNELRSGFSPFLGELIATLLRKTPADRFASAETVRAVLEKGEASQWWKDQERAQLRRKRAVPVLPVARATPVFGRDQDLARLDAAWERACRGDGSVLLLLGEAGVGKTRLLDEFLTRVDPANSHVLYGERGSLREALARKLSVDDELDPVLRPFLGRETGGPRDEPALLGAIESVLSALAAESPLLMLLDDLDAAGPESLRRVGALAETVRNKPMLLIATAQEAPAALAHADRHELARLAEADAHRLVGDVDRADEIVAKAGGNPFFLLELAHAGSRETPAQVRDVVAMRLQGLAADDRELLDAACVQGVEFEPSFLATEFERPLIQVLARLATIERSHGIVGARGERYAFDHPLLRDILYDALPETLRRRHHAAVADALLRGFDPARLQGEDAFLAAEHCLRGTAAVKGLVLLDQALTWAEATFRNEETARLAALALDRPGLLTRARRAHVLVRMATRLDLLDRRDEARPALDEAVGLAPDSGQLLRAAGHLALRAGDLDRARERFEAAGDEAALGRTLAELGLFDEAQKLLEQAGAHVDLARVHLDAGRYDEAGAALEKARRTGAEFGTAQALVGLAEIAEHEGNQELAGRGYEKAAQIFRRIRSPQGVVTALARRAALPGGDPAAAVGAVRKYGSLLDFRTRIEAAYLLWKATGEQGWLDEARARLEAVDGTSKNIPLYQAILAS